jgi:hypothetical protein
VSFADAATDPIDFPIAPGFGVPIALKRAGVCSFLYFVQEIRSNMLLFSTVAHGRHCAVGNQRSL